MVKNLIFLVLITALFNYAAAQTSAPNSRNIVLITDMEPDDRIAINIISSRLGNRLLFAGSTVMNAPRKAFLIRQQFALVGLENVPVYTGTGGLTSDYVDISSSRAARSYEQEGKTVIPEPELKRLNDPQGRRSSNDLKIHLKPALSEASQNGTKLDFLMLAPPTDLVAVLEANPELKSAIGHIHVMGGWVDVKNAQTGEVEKRTTYNWNMAPEASRKLMAMSDIPMTLYSSHTIKAAFAGGSINTQNAPDLVSILENSDTQAMEVFRRAAQSWDHHLMEKIPALQNVIGANAGKQFTPADPLVVVGMINPDLIENSTRILLNIETADLDSTRGYKVEVREDAQSQIRLVDSIRPEVFISETVSALHDTARRSAVQGKKANVFPSLIGSCKSLFN